MKTNKVVNNTIMLYIMSVAKLIFPLLTLPYLTRVLSEETYGFVSYVQSCMSYMQIIIDFGFILSAVKDIVNAKGDNDKIGVIVGTTFCAKVLLAVLAAVVLAVMCAAIPLLRTNITFVTLSFIAVAVNLFLADFLFRGIEKMHFITVIYVISKFVSTALTFILVKNNGSLVLIPLLDIAANLISAAISFGIIIKLKIKVRFGGFKMCFAMIKDSFTYFLSSVATTAFSALNTLLIGIYVSDLTQVAYWSVCLRIISAIQGLYSPLCNSIYPHMILKKDLKVIHKVMAIFMPVVIIGCAACFFFAKFALLVVGGKKYVAAYSLFRWLIPILFFSFPAQIYGWPALGAIGMAKQTTASTVIAAVLQVVGLFALIRAGQFNLINLAVLRGVTECSLMAVRMFIVYKNRARFSGSVCEERK